VDWCDAHAYCKWAGKHLCGKIGGGAIPISEYANAQLSEWFNACSAGGSSKFPYGSTYDPQACVGADYDGIPGFSYGSDMVRAVASAWRCHGITSPFDAIYDMSGNVWEWEDSCDVAVNPCQLRGGSVDGAGTCDAVGFGDPREIFFNIGFRCCTASL
jgi:formylglycine-generating enzyme required for sulfatase activity